MPDPGFGWKVLIILLLIGLNGLFAMSEIAVVSSRKARLESRAGEGDRRARRALELASKPNRFLSTVQIGISLVGILAGAYGGAALAGPLAGWLAEAFPSVAAYAEGVALAVVVAAITYLSLVLGELVPKRIGLAHPERIAGLVARPMNRLSVVASPLVSLLSVSTDAVLRLIPLRRSGDPPVTEEEITVQLEAGTRAGVFEEEEQEMVERVFRLADRRADALMTPRHRIAWIDVHAPIEAARDTMTAHRHGRFPVCDGDLDHVLGVVHVTDALAAVLTEGGAALDLRALLRRSLYVPPTAGALQLLEQFRESGIHMAVVVDEYGGTEGLITLNDLLEEISGDLAPSDEPRVVARDDGSWLVDGGLAMEEVRQALGLEPAGAAVDPGPGRYRTLAGFLVQHLGRLPAIGDSVDALDHRFEIVDMDGHRVDRVLVEPDRTE